MRASLLLLCIAAHAAHAGTRIVLMADPADASALRVALAGKGTEIAELPAPEGALRLDRAAYAQRSAVDAQAIAGVWIEQEPGSAEVCVVSSDGRLFRHAPLPLDVASPRVFAAVATSLLDEVLAPPDAPAVNVDVHVDVMPPLVDPFAPSMRPERGAPGITASAPEGVVRANRTLVEIGPMLSPLTAGLEGEIAFPLGEQLRVGALAAVNTLFTKPEPLYLGALELRHVGQGIRHYDLGVVGGAAVVEGGANPFVGLRLERVWEGSSHGLGLSVNPVLAFVGGSVYPGVWTSLRWELPL